MSLFILLSIVVGLLWGKVMADTAPLFRRGFPALTIVLGGLLLRQAVTELGAEAVQSGDLNTTGMAGVMLILFGLMALLSLTVINLGGELNKAQRNARRRK